MHATRPRLILVDDCPDSRELLRRSFELDGRFEVVGLGASGIDAIRLTEAFMPDVVVLDLLMPEMDGFTAIPEIHRAAPAAKIVALSSYESLGTEVSSLRVDAFCAKDRALRDAVTMVATVARRGRPVVV